MELFSGKMRKVWNDWDLKVMVLLNLGLQLLLLFLGSRRKSSRKIAVRVIVWCAYISADSVAGIALGMLSSKLGDQIGEELGELDDKSKLIAFWAPTLLLLLGGPDTITAYSMEDNELWLRHLLGLVVQTGVTVYICLMTWSTASYLSYLSLAMLVAAVIKYGERVWVLWQASKEKRKSSMLAPPYAGTNYPTFMEEYALKQQEGYHVAVDEIVELPVPKQLPATNNQIKDAEYLIKASHLHQIVMRFFLDLVMTDDDRDVTVSIFHPYYYSDWKAAFKVLEIELSFMYDFLHTKAMILYSRWGVVRRLITLAISSVVLIVFSCLVDLPRYLDKGDIGVTFLVLGVIVLLDVYSILAMLTSDWTLVWLSKKEATGPKFGLDRVVPCLPKWFKQVRWSNSVGQLSFLSSCTKRTSLPCQSILKQVHGQIDTHYHVRYQELLNTMKRAMLDYVCLKHDTRKDEKAVYDLRLCLVDVMKRNIGFDIEGLEWSTEMEFDKCILVWHVATELCYHHCRVGSDEEFFIDNCYFGSDEEDNKSSSDFRLSEGETSYNLVANILSRYMYYLLVLYPFMLPSGTGQIRVRDTCAEARKFFEERGLWSSSASRENLQLHSQACDLLLEVNTEVPPNKVKGERSKSVLFDGCRLATGLIKKFKGDVGSKILWRVIAEIWMEILAIAASQSTGESHAQQLRRGGELLTFEWLLLAHFGLTNHFQMTKGHAIAKLILH